MFSHSTTHGPNSADIFATVRATMTVNPRHRTPSERLGTGFSLRRCAMRMLRKFRQTVPRD
jgi:hypothetical protein